MASSGAIEQIKSDEGFSKKAEKIKTQGGGQEDFFTIGHGFSLQNKSRAREDLILAGVHPARVDTTMNGEVEISAGVADTLFQISLQRAERDAENIFSNFASVPQNIKDVLVNMSFQLGATNLRKFKKMKKAVESENWPEMRKEMLDSKWARSDSTSRANRLAKQVKEVKFTPIPAPIPQTALARKGFLEKAYQEEDLDAIATRLAGATSLDMIATRLAKSSFEFDQRQAAEEATKTEETAKPKLEKMEQGLFEDEAGKKFFVDADNRLLELDEQNQPRAVIDPSKFDLTKVNRETAQPNPEEDIF